MLRKNTRRRAAIFFSWCSARNASYMWNGSALAKPSNTKESCTSGSPGIDEGAHVDVGCNSDAGRIRKSVHGPALLVFERLDRSQRVQRRNRRSIRCDCACRADLNSLPREERFAERVRRRRTREGLKHEHRMIRGSRVQLFERGQTLLGKLHLIPSAHGRNEFPRGHRFRARRDRRLNVFDRGSCFEPCIVAGTQAQQHDVVVIVDQSRHCRAAAQIDGLGARARLRPRKIEAPVLDGHRRQNGIARVHGHDLSVDQAQIAGAGAVVGRRQYER